MKYQPYIDETKLSTKVKQTNYVTTADSRGVIPVYEYSINNDKNTVKWDIDSGQVHWTALCKIAKINPLTTLSKDMLRKARKIKGGNLNIQGTW